MKLSSLRRYEALCARGEVTTASIRGIKRLLRNAARGRGDESAFYGPIFLATSMRPRVPKEQFELGREWLLNNSIGKSGKLRKKRRSGW